MKTGTPRLLGIVMAVALFCNLLGIFGARRYIRVESSASNEDPMAMLDPWLDKPKKTFPLQREEPSNNPTEILIHENNARAIENTNSTFSLRRKDMIRNKWLWESAPVVVESHKLIFYMVPKVGCTVFKRLFRRMMGYENWRTKDPHDPSKNGLKYLSSYSVKDATSMMTSREWTKAIFVRDPKERLLSAYLDKAVNKDGIYVQRHCCRDCVPETMSDFLGLTEKCFDPHWAPQSERMSDSVWELMDFVGSFSNAQNDTKELLERIGAWDQYGSGWGPDGNEEIFGATKTNHATGSTSRFHEYFTESIEEKAEKRYAADYENKAIARALMLVKKF